MQSKRSTNPVMDEVEAAAKWVAARGGKGLRGEPLPNLMSAAAVDWIAKNQEYFYAMVVWAPLEAKEARNG